MAFNENLRTALTSKRFDRPRAQDMTDSHPTPTPPNAILEIGKDPLRVAFNDAKAVIAGYCFKEQVERWNVPEGIALASYAPPAVQATSRRWAYRVYDCVPSSIGRELNELDLLMPVALNAAKKYGARLLERLRAAAPAVIEAMNPVPYDAKFWDIPLEHIQPEGTPPEGSVSWAIHRSWAILTSVPDCGRTITHKILHHKWPNLFPLIDARTVEKLEDGAAWVNVHRDLTRHQDPFADLETWFEDLCQSRPGARPIGRLRMHDILLWCYASGSDFEEARDAGKTLLASTT